MNASSASKNPDSLALPDIERELWKEDPVFSSWAREIPDKHWSKYDLSAVRLGYEFAKKLYGARLAKLEQEQTAVHEGLIRLEEKLETLPPPKETP